MIRRTPMALTTSAKALVTLLGSSMDPSGPVNTRSPFPRPSRSRSAACSARWRAKASTVKEGRVIVLRLCRVLGDLNTPFRSSD